MTKLFFSSHYADKSSRAAIKAIIISAFLSIIIRGFGFLKESMIAYYFGVSEYIDFYVLTLIFVTFFASPIGGSLATLLTQKFIEIKLRISKNASADIFIKCQVFGFASMIVIISIQIVLLHTSVVKEWIESRFSILEIDYTLFLLPIGALTVMSLINSSILTAEKQFKTYTILPVLVPITILIALTNFSHQNLFQVLMISTLLGFLLEFLFSFFCIRNVLMSIKLQLIKKSNQEFRKIVNSMPPMVMSSIVMSGCLIVDQLMATLAGSGSVSIINFGNRIPLAFISIIAIIWTVLYPKFIELVSKKNFVQLRKNLTFFSIISVVLLVPLCTFFAYFSEEITSILYERGAFNANNTYVVSQVQLIYLLHISLCFLCMIYMRVANAVEKAKIILIGNILLLILNITLNFYFINIFGLIGIPLATLAAYSFVTVFWFLTTSLLIRNRL